MCNRCTKKRHLSFVLLIRSSLSWCKYGHVINCRNWSSKCFSGLFWPLKFTWARIIISTINQWHLHSFEKFSEVYSKKVCWKVNCFWFQKSRLVFQILHFWGNFNVKHRDVSFWHQIYISFVFERDIFNVWLIILHKAPSTVFLPNQTKSE